MMLDTATCRPLPSATSLLGAETARDRLDTARPVPSTPYLEVAPQRAGDATRALIRDLPVDEVHYAVKANPHPAVLQAVHSAGGCFDVASPAEIRDALNAGAVRGALVYSHPIKRWDHIEAAVERGVDLFVADSTQEVHKLAQHAPGARVLARLATSGAGADWPLSRKFGAPAGEVEEMLRLAHRLGLHAAGISFHVGSQQGRPSAWKEPVDTAAALFTRLSATGIDLNILDIGGGIPALVDGPALPTWAQYGATIDRLLRRAFGNSRPRVIAEPGRAIAACTGRLVTTVVQVLEREGTRWVFLDAGVFSGLVECVEEAIRYRLTPSRLGPTGPCVLAGPTCDSLDVLYQKLPVHLPLDLAPGDNVTFEQAGAYTASYATVGFNGFEPLPVRLVR